MSEPLTRPSATLSPLCGARGTRFSVLLPACGEKVPEGRMRGGADLPFHGHDLPHLAQEPRIDGGELIDLFDAHAPAEGVADGEDALRARRAEELDDVIAVVAAGDQAAHADLERAQPLLQRLVECAADGHGLADRLHRQAEERRRLPKFLEGKARDLDHHVVEGRLERRRRFLGDVVRDLVEGVAGRELRRELRDRKPRRLRGQRR